VFKLKKKFLYSRTYTGLQTLGAETVCEVELDRSTIGLPVENLLNHPVGFPAKSNDQMPGRKKTATVS